MNSRTLTNGVPWDGIFLGCGVGGICPGIRSRAGGRHDPHENTGLIHQVPREMEPTADVSVNLTQEITVGVLPLTEMETES